MFKIPAYTAGEACGDIKFAFCDKNVLVSCEKNRIETEDCGEDTCMWFPGLATFPKLDDDHDDTDGTAECLREDQMEEIETCSTENVEKHRCSEGGKYIEVATVTNQVCLKAQNGQLYNVFYASDTYCGDATCSADKKSCGKAPAED